MKTYKENKVPMFNLPIKVVLIIEEGWGCPSNREGLYIIQSYGGPYIGGGGGSYNRSDLILERI